MIYVGFTIQYLLLFLLLFTYDCYYHNWIISKVFYYLPFYMLYNLWYKSSQFICSQNARYNRIIYERYYCRDVIIYYALTDEEETILEDYIRKGFKYNVAVEDIYTDIDPIMYIEDF